jgi:hypothetical protein
VVQVPSAYLFRYIIHDYSTAILFLQKSANSLTLRILGNIVPAMSSDSVILIAIKIILDSPAGVDLNKMTNEIKMLSLVTQSEKRMMRTENGYKRLIKIVRLQFVKVHRAGYGNVRLIEARLPCFQGSLGTMRSTEACTKNSC